MSGLKRSRKPSSKKRDAEQPEEAEKTMWCTVELQNTDGSKKEHLVTSKVLETESGTAVTLRDLYFENKLIWVHRKKPYEVTLLETHRVKPTKRRILEHDESDDEIPSPPIKQSKDNDDVENEAEDDIEDVDKDYACFDDGSCETPKGQTKPLSTQVTQSTTQTAPSYSPMSNGFMVPFSSANTPMSTPKSINGTPKSVCTSKSSSSKDEQDIKDHLDRIESKLDKLLKHINTSTKKKNPADDDTSTTETVDSKFITESGVNVLTLRAETPWKYALSLMDIFFSESEMAKSCYTPSKRTQKPPLDQEKVSFLEECIKKKFELSSKEFEDKYGSVVRRKCMQKCLDKNRMLTFKKELECKLEKQETITI